ncbi:hypothetical protein Acsp05_03420 [Actinokineospora sp. NBRC 105648]|nr:hypothetical protein Acsp05_03420 [Actinokineospora sp. NBRC 105648]
MVVVSACGEIDSGTVADLVEQSTQTIEQAAQTGADLVLVDLSGTTFPGSAAEPAALMEATSSARDAGVELRVIIGSAHAALRAGTRRVLTRPETPDAQDHRNLTVSWSCLSWCHRRSVRWHSCLRSTIPRWC